MNPQTVNAYNGGLENKIVFPAGILQPPFFDPTADPAVNYGAIGAVIATRSPTASTTRAAKSTTPAPCATGGLPRDAKRFEAQAAIYGAQYDTYEGAPGMHINGKLTMGENIADLGGLLMALDAYHASLNGAPAPVIAA